MNLIYSRIIAVILFIVTIFFGISIVLKDYAVMKILREDSYEVQFYDKVFDLPVYYEPSERVAVKIFNAQLNAQRIDCKLLSKMSAALLESNPRSSQAYYFNAVCFEKKGELKNAYEQLVKASIFDPFNTTYMLGLAVIQLNLGQFVESQEILNKIRLIAPDTKNLESIQDSLNSAIDNDSK